jgi:predicted extracellular nuclease
MLKKSVFLISIVLTTAVFSFAQDNVSIGAWNIQWLGNSEQRPGQAKKVEQKPEDLATYIADSKVDVLSMEEISDTDDVKATHTNRILDEVFKQLNKTGGNNWKYLLFPKRNQAATTQLTGIAWNEKEVKKIGEPFRIPLKITDKLFSYWDRWATAIKFQAEDGKTDFVVVPLHLKANTSKNADKQRAGETKFLVNALNLIRKQFKDDDIVFIGDTNFKNKSEAANITSAGFVDLNSADKSTVAEGKAPFDRAFIPKKQAEFKNAKQDVFKPTEIKNNDFKINYSDHFMVRFLVQVMADDDK